MSGPGPAADAGVHLRRKGAPDRLERYRMQHGPGELAGAVVLSASSTLRQLCGVASAIPSVMGLPRLSITNTTRRFDSAPASSPQAPGTT